LPTAPRTTEPRLRVAAIRASICGLLGLLLACGDDAGTRRDDAATTDAATDAAVDATVIEDAAIDASHARSDAAMQDGSVDANLEEDAGTEPDARVDATVAPSGARERTMLVHHGAWALLSEASDPFDDATSEATPCDMFHLGSGFGYELFVGEEAFFVQTGFCDYLTVEQPTLVEIREGELVKVRLWHFELTAPEDGEAHVVVRLGDETLFEDHIPIPIVSELLSERWTAPRDIPAGTPVQFHIHNHGANEYALIEISTGPDE
jgi:hypothetical protein